MIQKAGSRVELSTWPTTLVLEAEASEGQAVALVIPSTGAVIQVARSGNRWSLPLKDVTAEAELVVYRADENHPDSGPMTWNIEVSGQRMTVERSDRSHTATILMALYPRNGRRMARISGDGYAFGIDAYTRANGMNRDMFERIRPRVVAPPPPQGSPGGAPYRGSLEGQGSGVSVGPGLVVTNHHVVEDVRRLVVAHEGRRSDAHVLMTDEAHDLALIRHELQGLDPIAQRDPAESHLGEEILTAGFPLAQMLGDDLKISYGNVSGLRGGLDVSRVQFTAPIASGSSGGALLDLSGRLVGLVSAALRHSAFADRGVASENVNFAIKASLVREMMVAAGASPPPYADNAPLGRAALAQAVRRCIVSVDCHRE